MNQEFLKELRSVFEGDMYTDPAVLHEYSHDASVCEIVPQVVLCPKTVADIKSIVKFVHDKKTADGSGLAITVRSAGTDMSGGAIGESIILDVNKYIRGIISWNVADVTVLPGTFYRDFEKETMARGFFLPSFPASRLINTVGGMVGNNSAGEKTLTYGQTERYVKSVKMILRDGNEYEFRPLGKKELEAKCSLKNKGGENAGQPTIEAEIYSKIWQIVSENSADLEAAKPKTSKNSAGYALWNVWNQESQTFDITKIIVGSQGTLGVISEITFSLVPVHKESQMLVVFLPSLDPIGPLVKDILPFQPTSLESYDEDTIRLAVKYFRDLPHQGKLWDFIKLAWNFIPEFHMARSGGFPKLVLLIEFTGDSKSEISATIKKLQSIVAEKYQLKTEHVKGADKAKKYWTIRHESYNLLRMHSGGKRIATFIEDVIVPPDNLPEFFPKFRDILHSYDLTYSIAGHAGSGNFHVFPLMDFNNPVHIENIIEISNKVYDLVAQYGGSITAEHNDGIVRTPYLSKMFSEKILSLFADLKHTFDPQNMFNPGKKVGATLEYFKNHIIK